MVEVGQAQLELSAGQVEPHIAFSSAGGEGSELLSSTL